MFFAIILIFLASATIVGNAICLLVLRKQIEGIGEVVRIFMKSLAAADLFTGIFVITPAIGPAITDSWPYTYTYCRINALMQNFLGSCSVLSLVAVNIERYIAIEFPLHYTTLVTAVKARVVVVSLWIVGAGFAVFNVLQPGQVNTYHEGIFLCVTDPIDPEATDITSIIWALGFFAFPISITVCLFLRLYCISRAHARRIDAEESAHHQVASNTLKRFHRAEFKTTVTFFILTILLIITYIPTSIAIALDSSGNLTQSQAKMIGHVVVCLWLSNSCINVIIYSVRTTSFRQRAKQILGCFVTAFDNHENGNINAHLPNFTG